MQFRSRSTSLEHRNGEDETPETPSYGKSEESDDRATVKSGISFDLDSIYPEVFRKTTERETSTDFQTFGEKVFGEKVETLYKNFYDRAGPSTDEDMYSYRTDDTFYNTSADVNDPLQIQRMSVNELFEKFCADEREIKFRPAPIRQASETCFRTTRLRGISSDRLGGIFVKKTRTDRMSTSSLGDQPGTGSCFSIFDKRKGKLGKLEKSKRLSTSALYDQSPTGNIAKTTRIRSNEDRLNKSYNSDELPEKGDQFYEQTNAPSTSKSDNFVSKFRFDENLLERASVARLYEKFCSDTPLKPASLDTSLQSSRILEEKSIDTTSSKLEIFSAMSLSEKTSDIMNSTIKTNADLDNVDNIDNIDKSEMCFSEEQDVSNTVQLLFEDPRSNRTSVSDIYEPCFSVSLTPRQPSFKRGSLKNNWMELTTMDLRAIDDESPTTSKLTNSSPDDLNNTDVFMTPDYQFSFSINGDTLPTLADIHEGDSTEENSFSESSAAHPNRLVPSKSVSSRSSMQKLQPIMLNNFSESDKNDGNDIELVKLSLKNNCTELTLDSKNNKQCQTFKLKKNKQIDNVIVVQKRTRCFPL